jgi:hypothetical protein
MIYTKGCAIMKDGIIMISVPATTTTEDIKQIREQYKNNNDKLNILISGNSDFKETLYDFLKTVTNP